MTVRQVLCGLVVESDVPVVGTAPSTSDGPADLVVRLAGSHPVPYAVPAGRVLQTATWGGELQYSAVERAGGEVLLRLHGLVDFLIAPDRASVRAVTDPECDDEMLGILVGGNLLSMVLALRGETVLHASAVEVDGRVVAFVAHSGGGKSTLATLAAARGARFVTDDVLRTFVDDQDVVRCWPGSPESRLRSDLHEIADGVLDPSAAVRTRTSVDGRVVWSPESSAVATPRLAAIVLPSVTDETAELAVVEVSRGAAVMALTGRPRIVGVTDPALRTREFANLAELVRRVPVFAAEVPWGPPFAPDMIDELLGAVGVAPAEVTDASRQVSFR